jgi:homoserine dehydrogenase
MADQHISIASVIQNRSDRPGAASLVLTTHESNERAIQTTLGRLEKLSIVLERPLLLRIADFND